MAQMQIWEESEEITDLILDRSVPNSSRSKEMTVHV